MILIRQMKLLFGWVAWHEDDYHEIFNQVWRPTKGWAYNACLNKMYKESA